MTRNLNIVVCMKQVPDPEAPPSAFLIDSQNLSVSASGVPPVISAYDENALELAIRLKEKSGGKITILSVGKNISRAVIFKAAASGADEILLVDDPELERNVASGSTTAKIIAAAIQKRGAFDLIITGRQASDTNAGIVGIGIAHYLGIPCITLARHAQAEEGDITVERVLPSGYEVLKTAMPALLTISYQVGALRYPTLISVRASKDKPMTVMTLADLGLDSEKACPLTMHRLEVPDQKRSVMMIGGKDSRDAGAKLAIQLRQEKVL